MKDIPKIPELKRNKLLDLENVVGVGYGYKEKNMMRTDQMAVKVLVRKKMPENMLLRSDIIPKQIDGVLTDVIEVGDVRLLGITAEYHRPARPGISIGHYKISAGTFGAVVKDKETGEPMILSNNHVLANATDGKDGRAQKGDPIFQPGPHDGGTADHIIGYLERFIPLYREMTLNGKKKRNIIVETVNFFIGLLKLKTGQERNKILANVNLVDAALAKPISEDVINPEILGIGLPRGINEVKPGKKVRKSGRSSGVNDAEIKAVDASLRVMVTPTEVALFSQQVITSPMAEPGDSGSLVLDEENRAVGLLFAGSDKVGIFNRIDNVLNLLNITI